MRILLLLALLGCRRKHPAPVEEVVPPPPVVEPEAPTVVEAPPPPPAAPTPAGHPPTDDEVREKLRPVLPEIARCVQLLRPEGPVVLRFAVSPATGGTLAVELAGRRDECSERALSAMRFEQWSGAPNFVELPLTREGRTMVQTDGGLK